MLGNPISSILRRATRKPGDRLNILTFSGHERFDPLLCNINADFYSLPGQNVKPWNTKYSKIPDNYYFVKELKPHLVFDAIICHNPACHIPLAIPLSKQLHIPIINIFHTDSPVGYSKEVAEQHRGFFNECHHHVFITEYNKLSWYFKDGPNISVIEHGIDCEEFKSNGEKQDVILTVGNDCRNRDPELGFSIWNYIVKDLPFKLIGDNPGLSVAANSKEELIGEFQKSRIYLNTTLRSPLPMSIMEAASMELGIVTTNTCALPDYFIHGENCLMFSPNEPDVGKRYVVELLKNKELCERLGKNARKTMQERFKINTFVKKWETLLEDVCGRTYV